MWRKDYVLWREPVADDEMINLVESHGGTPSVGWWSRVSACSLGWGSARNPDGLLVGFVNVAWDGGDHGFLVDTKTRASHQHRGIGRELVRRAAENAKAAGCEWLHVDFESHLARFYLDACGFSGPTLVSSICRQVDLPDSSQATWPQRSTRCRNGTVH
jgi:GNAT superfamily N-acetyltransferase